MKEYTPETKYYKTYEVGREFLEPNKIKISKNSLLKSDGSLDFDGSFYIRTLIPNLPINIDSLKITYTFYVKNAIGYEEQVGDSRTLTIKTYSKPQIDISLDGRDYGVATFGNPLNISVVTDETITWSLSSVTDPENTNILNELFENIEPIKTKGNYVLNIRGIKDIGSNYADYIGKKFKLVATIEKIINGKSYPSYDSVEFIFAKFIINSIDVKYVENGLMTGMFNQPYDLQFSINATYDRNIEGIYEDINNLATNWSKASSGNFYYINGNYRTPLNEDDSNAGLYPDFKIEIKNDLFYLTNNRINSTSKLVAAIRFEYTSVSDGSANGLTLNSTGSNYAFEIKSEFGLGFTRLSSEANPEPIYTSTQFANMQEGGDYILLADIELTNWEPLNANFSSLDGNGYVITLKSFHSTTITVKPEEGQEVDLNLGIFSTISSNTTIKNVIVEVPPMNGSDLNTNAMSDINVDAMYYKNVIFGILAAKNEGIVTNVVITNNADSDRLVRENALNSEITELKSGENQNENLSVRNLSTINIYFGTGYSSNNEHRIAGLVGINDGYISNSNINNISIKGLDCVAGFVAENNNIISSSYFNGGNVSAITSIKSDENTITNLGAAGFVYFNNGKILYSYTSGGKFKSSSSNKYYEDFTGLNLKSSANNYLYPTYNWCPDIRMMSTGVISENGNASSFVYSNANNAIISDCYSNFLVYGFNSTGFIYENDGTINNVYTLSATRNDVSSAVPFISLRNNNEQANNDGKITNAYYLKILGTESSALLDTELYTSEDNTISYTYKKLNCKDIYKVNEELQVASAISLDKLSLYNSFETFAFNANYDVYSSNGDISYSENVEPNHHSYKSIEEIARSVWFFPSTEIISSGYFRNTNYTMGAPQLVSANLYNYSLKKAMFEDSTEALNAIYDLMLNNYEFSTFGNDKDRNNIVTYIQKSNSQNSYNIAKIDIYLSNPNYISVTKDATTEGMYIGLIKNAVINAVELNAETDLITVTFHNKNEGDVPEDGANTYQYENILSIKRPVMNGSKLQIPENQESIRSIDVIYGDSILNPYLIKNSKDYNKYILQINDKGESEVSRNWISKKHLRLVSDITFGSEDNNALLANTYNVDYRGVLDGNGMTISNVNINADATKSDNAITVQFGDTYQEKEKVLLNTYTINDDQVEINGVTYNVYIENEISRLTSNPTFDYVIDNNKVYVVQKATSLGLFAKVTNGGVVKNLNVDINEVYGSGVNFVGTIAGQLVDGKLYNIKVTGDSKTIYGLNAVGGVVGKVTGDSVMVNIDSQVSVTSNNEDIIKNSFKAANPVISNNSTFNVYIPAEDKLTEKIVNGKIYYALISNIDKISYTGGVAGILNVENKEINNTNAFNTNTIARFRYNMFGGKSTISGEIVGGLYGYMGSQTFVSQSGVEVQELTSLKASRIAGGLVGMNEGGIIARSYVINTSIDNDDYQNEVIDKAIEGISANEIETQLYGDSINTGSATYFTGNPHYMGGLIGFNKEGRIENCYNRVDVVNIDSMYAGGLVGVNIGGEISTSYTTASVYGYYGVGGIIGLNGDYVSFTSDSNKVIENLRISNWDTWVDDTKEASINMNGIVAANLWKKTHLNIDRYDINKTQDRAFVGSLIGCQTKAGGLVVNSEIDRLIKEDMFTITAYTYRSINNYVNASSKSSYYSFKLIDEIGNIGLIEGEQTTLQIAFNQADSATGLYSDPDSDGRYIVGTHYSYHSDDNNTNIDMYSGNVIFKDDIDSSVHFSRLRKYSSSRSLKEIIARIYSSTSATISLELMRENFITSIDGMKTLEELLDTIALSENDDFYLTNDGKLYKTAQNDTETHNTLVHAIYNNAYWKSSVWAGFGVSSTNSNGEKFDDKHIYPIHEVQLSDPIIQVRTYSDLLKVKEYPYGTFVLMNNIEICDTTPLLSKGNPFTGAFYSNPSRTDTTTNFKITFNHGLKGSGAVGLFAAIKGASIENIDFVVRNDNSCTCEFKNNNGDILIEDGVESAGGVLFGYAFSRGYATNKIRNVTIEFTDNTKVYAPNGASYIGALGGSAENLDIVNLTIKAPKIVVGGIDQDGSIDKSITAEHNRSMYVGTIAGYASIASTGLFETINVGTDGAGSVDINIKMPGDSYGVLAIGGVFGKVYGINNSTLGDMGINNDEKAKKHINIATSLNINIASLSDNDFAYYEYIGIGGTFGIVNGSGYNTSDKFTIENLTNTLSSFKYSNIGVYVASNRSSRGHFGLGGFVGLIGTEGDGVVAFGNNIVLGLDSSAFEFKHKNLSSNKLSYNLNSSNINIGGSVGSILSGNINTQLPIVNISSLTITELDAVTINIGTIFGSVYNGEYSFTQTNSLTINAYIGENTKLNIGGLIGTFNYATVKQSYYKGDIILTLDASSYSNINMGGLVGYSTNASYLECFASGSIQLNVNAGGEPDKMKNGKLGGMIGYVYNSINIKDCYTTNAVALYSVETTTQDDQLSIVENSLELSDLYSALGGIIGKLEVSNEEYVDNVVINSSYSISNILSKISSDKNSNMGGIIGCANKFNQDIDIYNYLTKIENTYYLAEFMVATNNIGTPLGVEEMLFDNGDTYVGFDTTGDPANGVGAIWTIVDNNFPQLNKFIDNAHGVLNYNSIKTRPETSFSGTIESGYSYILSSTTLETTIETLNNNDIFFNGAIAKIGTIDSGSRVYGLTSLGRITNATIIQTNNGKVSCTNIANDKELNGQNAIYIGTNNGIDIHPRIGATGAVVYNINNSLVVYGNFFQVSIMNIVKTLDNEVDLEGVGKVNASKGSIEYSYIYNSIVNENYYDDANEFNAFNIRNSYINGGSNYSGNTTPEGNHYFDNNGKYLNLSVEDSKVLANFAEDGYEFDFYNDWYYDTNHGTKLRWQIKELCDGWFKDDIDIYSTTQTEYKNYSWNNYINAALQNSTGDGETFYLGGKECKDDLKLTSDSDKYTLTSSISGGRTKYHTSFIGGSWKNLCIYSNVGLAYFAKLVNEGIDFSDFTSIQIMANIDMGGKIFTPIGGAKTFDGNINSFAGSFNGNNAMFVIKNITILGENGSGMFGDTRATNINNLTIENANVYANYGNAGILFDKIDLDGKTQNSLTINKIEIRDSIVINADQVDSIKSYSGALAGQIRNFSNVVKIENCKTSADIVGGDIVGGAIGNIYNVKSLSITRLYNTSNYIMGNEVAGGLVGLFEMYNNYLEVPVVTITKSYNEGDVYATNPGVNVGGGENTSYAGGLIGFISSGLRAHYKLSDVFASAHIKSNHYAAGLINSTSQIELQNVYFSRGDIWNEEKDQTNLNTINKEANTSENILVDPINGGVIEDEITEAGFVNNFGSSVTIENAYLPFIDLPMLKDESGLNGNKINTVYKLVKEESITAETNNYRDQNHLTNEIIYITENELKDYGSEIFPEWNFTWSRIIAKNNAYPILMIINETWETQAVTEENGVYNIYTPEQLAWVAEQVNTNIVINGFAGKLIQLQADIDLEQKIFKPIGYLESRSFKGEFHPNGHTIKGLTSVGYFDGENYNTKQDLKPNVGLFGYTKGATIYGGLTIDNAYVGSFTEKDSNVGALIGYAKDTELKEPVSGLNGITITNSVTVASTGYNLGSLIGQLNVNKQIEIHKVVSSARLIPNKNGTSDNVGGIIGVISGTNGNMVNITSVKYNGKFDHSVVVGAGLVAKVSSQIDLNILEAYCGMEGITTSGEYAGGLVAYTAGSLTLRQLYNLGKTATINASQASIQDTDEVQFKLTSKSNKAFVGGIAGFVQNKFEMRLVTIELGKIIIETDNNGNNGGAVGGLIGKSNSFVINEGSNFEHSLGTIKFVIPQSSTRYIGGLVGATTNFETNRLNFTLNVEDLKGREFVGSIAGFVENVNLPGSGSMAMNITSNMTIANNGRFVGGVFGYIANTTTQDYIYLKDITIDLTLNSDSNLSYVGGIAGAIGAVNINEDISALSDPNDKKLSNQMGGSKVILDGNNVKLNMSGTDNANYVGGLVGYLKALSVNANIKPLIKNNTIQADSNILGNEYVGGIVGKLEGLDQTRFELYQNTVLANIKAGNLSGGIVGEAIYTDINWASVLDGKIEFTKEGCSGGIAARIINSNIENSVVNVSKLVVTPKLYDSTDLLQEYKSYAGGIVGYAIEDRNQIYTIENVDFSSTNQLLINTINHTVNENVFFAGVVGYARNYSIFEASTNINIASSKAVQGIVNTLQYTVALSDANQNWFSNKNLALNIKVYQESGNNFNDAVLLSDVLQMAVSTDASTIINYNQKSSATDLDETVLVFNSNTFNLANKSGEAYTVYNNIFLKNFDKNEDEKYQYALENVKQLYNENGIWYITKNSITMISDMRQRSGEILEKFELEDYRLVNDSDYRGDIIGMIDEDDHYIEFDVNSNIRYQDIYTALTKRYSRNPEDISRSVKINFNNVSQDIITYSNESSDTYILNPLGSLFYPIEDLIIKGTNGNGFLSVNDGLAGKDIKVSVSTNDDGNLVLYGMIGYVSGSLDISNLEFKNSYTTAEDFVHDDQFKNTNGYYGTILAMGNIFTSEDITYNLKDIKSRIIDNGSKSLSIVGGVIGSIGTNEKMIFNLNNISSYGTYTGNSNYNDNINIGGIIGFVNSAVQIQNYENIYNMASIKNVSNAGGVIGKLYVNSESYTLKNMFSGVEYKSSSYQKPETSIEITGSDISGIIGTINVSHSISEYTLDLSNLVNGASLTTSNDAIGGIISRFVDDKGKIIVTNCYNLGDLISTNSMVDTYAGGIIGYMSNSKVKTGDMSGIRTNSNKEVVITYDAKYSGQMYGYINNSYLVGNYIYNDNREKDNNIQQVTNKIADRANNITISLFGKTEFFGGIIGYYYYNLKPIAAGIRYLEFHNVSNEINVSDDTAGNSTIVGGIISYVEDKEKLQFELTLKNVNSNSTLRGHTVGGFIGKSERMYSVRIRQSEVSGTIGVLESTQYAGGFIGFASSGWNGKSNHKDYLTSGMYLAEGYNSTISCVANINGQIAGGFIGYSEIASKIEIGNIYVGGNIYGELYAGGIVGKLDNSYENFSDIDIHYDTYSEDTITQNMGTFGLGIGSVSMGDKDIENSIVVAAGVRSNNSCGGVIGWTTIFSRIDFVNILITSPSIQSGNSNQTKTENNIAGGIIGQVATDEYAAVMNFASIEMIANRVEGHTVGGLIGQAGSVLMSGAKGEGEWRNNKNNGIYRFLPNISIGYGKEINNAFNRTTLAATSIVGGVIGDGNPLGYYEGTRTGSIYDTSGNLLKVNGIAACQKTYTFGASDKDGSTGLIKVYKVHYQALKAIDAGNPNCYTFDYCGFSIGRALNMAVETPGLSVKNRVDISAYHNNGLFYQDTWYTESLDIVFNGSDNTSDTNCVVGIDEEGKFIKGAWFIKDKLKDDCTGKDYYDYWVDCSDAEFSKSLYSTTPLAS